MFARERVKGYHRRQVKYSPPWRNRDHSITNAVVALPPFRVERSPVSDDNGMLTGAPANVGHSINRKRIRDILCSADMGVVVQELLRPSISLSVLIEEDYEWELGQAFRDGMLSRLEDWLEARERSSSVALLNGSNGTEVSAIARAMAADIWERKRRKREGEQEQERVWHHELERELRWARELGRERARMQELERELKQMGKLEWAQVWEQKLEPVRARMQELGRELKRVDELEWAQVWELELEQVRVQVQELELKLEREQALARVLEEERAWALGKERVRALEEEWVREREQVKAWAREWERTWEWERARERAREQVQERVLERAQEQERAWARAQEQTQERVREQVQERVLERVRVWEQEWVREQERVKVRVQELQRKLNPKLNFKPCGSFCFSKDRNNLISVIPTLAYQLIDYSSRTIAPSPQFPKNWNPYSYALTTELVDDPLLLWKSPRVQLQKMIIEPLLKLQVEGWLNDSPPFLIVLDRIDECREDSQRELVAMISDAMRVHYDRLPLLWLISSPREKRLEKVFTDEVPGWHRVELIKGQKSNQKMPEGFDGVKSLKGLVKGFFKRLARLPRQFTQSNFIFRGIPAESKQLRRARIDNFPALCDALIFNQDALVETGAVPYRNPFEQLWYCFSYLETHNNLTESLRFFFEDTLRNASGTTKRILAHFGHLNSNTDSNISTQTFCNFLEMTQTNFYDALDKLESLIIVPPSEAVADKPLEADDSFMAYLQSESAKKYMASAVEIIQTCLRWHETDSVYHSSDISSYSLRFHIHDPLPGLTWTSTKQNTASISSAIAVYAEDQFRKLPHLWENLEYGSKATLFAFVKKLDYRYLSWPNDLSDLASLLNWFGKHWQLLRTHSSSEVEHCLVLWIKTMTMAVAYPARPIVDWADPRKRNASWSEYCFIGEDKGSAIIWMIYSATSQRNFCMVLDCQKRPTEEMEKAFRRRLQEISWSPPSWAGGG